MSSIPGELTGSGAAGACLLQENAPPQNAEAPCFVAHEPTAVATADRARAEP